MIISDNSNAKKGIHTQSRTGIITSNRSSATHARLRAVRTSMLPKQSMNATVRNVRACTAMSCCCTNEGEMRQLFSAIDCAGVFFVSTIQS